jgi:TPP-dependent pyruvate/acetoin dehydrogenase alpha subunit
VETVNYRLGAHSSSDDPTRYRDPEEVRAWSERDPVERLRRHIVQGGLWDEARESALRAELDAEVAETVARVEREAPPELATLFEDVYERRPWHLVEQAEEAIKTRR